jgi:hypothetical protein
MMDGKIVERNLFPLDSNIDGTYLDSSGVVNIIDNMIQVVSGVDGTQWYPEDDAIDFSVEEVARVQDVDQVVSDRGIGILYDRDGSRYAVKGDLVFRNDLGGVSTLSKILNKVSTIDENQDLTLRFKDKSLDDLIATKDGISIDQIIQNTKIKSLPFGDGNISQLTRNTGTKESSVSVFTIPVTPSAYVWVAAKASVTGPTTITLIDKTSNTILDTAFVDMDKYSGIVPCFISFVGQLPTVDTAIDTGKCDVAIYNSFFKRFFKPLDTLDNDTGLSVHELAIEIDGEGAVMEYATIDMMTFDSGFVEDVKNGVSVVNNSNEVEISFEEPISSNDYSVSIQTEEMVQTWYEGKSSTGFTAKLERPYSGLLYWSIVYSEVV